MPFYERQPFIQPLPSILREVMRGEIRVPRFQREGSEVTWTQEQRGDLLDSVYRGFPIGTVLLWSTEEAISTLSMVGGCTVMEADRARPLRLLLDGHQRLSTLVQILGPGLEDELEGEARAWARERLGRASDDSCSSSGSSDERWYFDLSEWNEEERPSRDRFVLLKPRVDVAQMKLLPLEMALSRVMMNRWVRENELSDAQTRMADSLRDRLREYNLPVAVLAAKALDEATESFKRINSSGTPMGDFHMVAALAYSPELDLNERFKELRESLLAPTGWADLSNTDLLRVCAGLLPRQHPSKLEVSSLAAELAKDETNIERAFEAVAMAAEWLAAWGIHGPKALPYSWQIITLAIQLGRGAGLDRGNAAHQEAACRWFWLSTYGGVFAGVNSAVYDRASKTLLDMASGGEGSAMQRDMSSRVGEIDRFDFRAVRARACVLAMARHQDRGAVNGPAHHALADLGTSALQTVWSQGRRSQWSDLAIVTASGNIRTIREALRKQERGEASGKECELLDTLGFDTDAPEPVEMLLKGRRQTLLDEERSFVLELGLEWEDAQVGEAAPEASRSLRSPDAPSDAV